MQILNEQQEELLRLERQYLSELLTSLVAFGVTDEDHNTLTESIQQLDDLFLLVVVGEFNAGKSAFINALLGQSLLEEGVTPTTTQINLLRYGEIQDRIIVNENQHILTLPVDWLAEISIVDTPGTNAIIRAHEDITSKFVPRSDLVLFITSADRPFTESERSFLEGVRDWGKKLVIVINKIDILQSENDLEQVIRFVSDNSLSMLGITPEIFPLSARKALLAKQGNPHIWQESRFEALESYIQDTLDEKSRIRLKFLNPLGVGLHLSVRYLEITNERLGLLQEDIDMLADVDSQLALFEEDMKRDFEFRMSDLENILYEMENRGQSFFDEKFRIARVFDLLSKDQIQKEFEQQVVGSVPKEIDRKVSELIDWLVETDLRQWEAVNDHLAERRRAYKDRIVGDPGHGSFHYDRERLMEAVGREAQRVVETYDKNAEAQEIAEDAQIAVAASAALEIGAVGLGTLVAALATTLAADITGVLLASLVAVLGLFVIPARRRAAKNELSKKITDLRIKLVATLQAQFQREINRSLHNIQEAIAPYTRFVRAERGKLMDMVDKMDSIQADLKRLRADIEQM